MFGFIILLFLAIYAFYKWKQGDKVTFYLIVIFLMDKCYHLTIFTETPGLRCDDIALLMLFATAYLTISSYTTQEIDVSKWVRIFLVFIAVSCIVSLVFWRLPIIQVFKGARSYLFLLALFDIMTLTKEDVKELLYKVFLLNVVFSGVFIVHTFAPALHILFDDSFKTGFLGLPRYWATPALLVYACMYSVFLYEKDSLQKRVIALLPFVALLLGQSRGQIMSTALIIILGFFFFNSSSSNKALQVLLGIVMLIFINSTILSGDTGSKTTNDINMISAGQVDAGMDRNEIEGNATMSFRYWVLLRNINALNEGNIINKIFGLGFFVDIDTHQASSMNIENICEIRLEDGKRTLYTPDIAYANIFAYLGYLGSFLYYALFFMFFRFFRNYTDLSIYARLGILYLFFILFTGLNSSFGTYASCLIMPLLLMQMTLQDADNIDNVEELILD